MWNPFKRRTSPDPQPQKPEVRDSGMSSLTNPEEWLLQAILGRVASATGITVTPLRAIGVSTVYACMRVRQEAMASLPLYLYKPNGTRGRVKATDHRLFSVMHDAPNAEMSAYDYISVMEGHLSLRQNAFSEIIRDSDGDPVGLYPIDPMDISVIRDTRTMKLIYKFMRNGTTFPMEDILHLKGYSRTGIIGIDMSTSLQEVFALAIALQDNAAKFFGNGSRPGAVLEHPGVMSPDAQTRLRDQVEQSTSGRNLYRTLVLEEGMKWTKQRSENKDSQFQEAREYQDLQICRVFKVPPHKVGIMSGQPRANIEQENIAFVTDTVRPECVNWEKALDMRLLTLEEREQGYGFRFHIDALLRGDISSRYKSYSYGRQWGWLSVNDIRAEENLNPVEGGDTYLQPLNMVPLGTLPVQDKASPEPDGDEGAEEGEDGEEDKAPEGEGKQPEDKSAKPAAQPAKDKGSPPPPQPKKKIGVTPTKPKEIAVVEDASVLKV